MKKHVREALKAVGLRPNALTIHNDGNHPYFIVNGRRITFACSPKNSDHTAKHLAQDIRNALNAQV